MIGGRATRWRRVVAAALPVLAIAANAAAQVIGPGHEREVIGLLAPAGLGGEIEPSWRVDGVSIDRDRITITLRHNDSTLIARLLPPGAPGDYRSANFAIAIDPNGVDRAEA